MFDRFVGHKFYDPTTCSNLSFDEMARIERKWIDESDIIFAYLNTDNPYGYGTVFEIGYAVANQKTVIYIDEKQVSSSKWVSEHVAYRFPKLEEGIECLAKILETGASFIADSLVTSIRGGDFRPLVTRELDDEVVRLVAEQIKSDGLLCTKLMLASQMLPREWFDWNLGYLLRHFDVGNVINTLKRYPENFYHSEGVAWTLGLIGNDDPAIISFLQEQCRKCEDYDAWWCAAHSLQQLNCGDAIDILKRTLKGEQWLDLDKCLASLGERPATIGILRTINRANIEQISKSCIDALFTLKGRRLHNVIWLLERLRLPDPEIVSTLIKLRESAAERGSSISHRVTEALGVIAHPSAREILEHDLTAALYFRTRALAARGLGVIGDSKSLVVLESALSQENDGHVLSALSEAIDEIRDPEKHRRNSVAAEAGWIESGMIIDETNKWYWSPDIYDRFSKAEDPQSIIFGLAIHALPKPIDTLVDLGSGTGRFIAEVLNSGCNPKKIYAVDRSKEMVEFLEKRFSASRRQIEVMQGELQALPLPDECADVVVSSWGFPSKIWDSDQALKELREAYRILRPNGMFLTIGWDEEFNDEMTEIWYRFVLEPDCYFDSLSDYRRRKRSRINSPRNCGLTYMKRRLSVPVRFQSVEDAAYVMGHLFGYSAGRSILQSQRREFKMGSSITKNSKEEIGELLFTRQ